jgi:hypothetical protein
MDSLDLIQVKDKANSIFAVLFPNIQCDMPYIQYGILYIPFTWRFISKGLMVFDESMSLDPFRCKPFQFEQCLVDWIKIKYLTKEPAVYEMEQFLRSINEV